MTPDVVSLRVLNRTTLSRQLLLERSPLPPIDAVDRLVGLQAQIPNNPYVALWSRLAPFDPMSLSAGVRDRSLVRTTVMRGTLHLVTADDCLMLRPLLQPVLEDELRHHRDFSPALKGVDLRPVIAFGRSVLSQGPMSGPELRAAMHERFPEGDAAALAFACRSGLALVQTPPRGEWGRSSQVKLMTAEAFLGRRVVARPSIDDVVLRYLRAFGPAGSSDVAAWCRLRGMSEVLERLRPRLRAYRSEEGRELFDLPDEPLADGDLPTPVRFLPEYDNLWLGYAERERVIAAGDVALMTYASSPFRGSVLIDGWLRAMWHVDRAPKASAARLIVRPSRHLAKRTASSVVAEGRRLARLIVADAEAEVTIEDPA